MTRIDKRTCIVCGKTARRWGNWKYCWPCNDKVTRAKAVAYRRVNAAIREGVLADPMSLRCADCGGQAREYDHRDYSMPLMVEPVCRSCNLKRGPAAYAAPQREAA